MLRRHAVDMVDNFACLDVIVQRLDFAGVAEGRGRSLHGEVAGPASREASGCARSAAESRGVNRLLVSSCAKLARHAACCALINFACLDDTPQIW